MRPRISENQIRLLVASGASAGHLYPAIAFAQSIILKNPRAEVAFVSSRRGGMEENIKAAGFPVFLISIRPLQFNFLGFLRFLYSFFLSFLQTFLIIEKFRPNLAAGFGSYISFPVILEAALFKRSTVIHEQNVVLGRANRFLSWFADKIAVSFRETAISGDKVNFIGYPLRQSLAKVSRGQALGFFGLEDKFTVLVLGGSQGSKRINENFKQALPYLGEKNDFQFIHISGKNDYSWLKNYYSCITINNRLFDFLSPMHFAYSLADIVVCRSGAGTISELAYFNKAAILIPYPYAGGHQLENALVLEKDKAAVVIEENKLSAGALAENISRLIRSPDERRLLETNIRKFAVPDADRRLADLALSLVD